MDSYSFHWSVLDPAEAERTRLHMEAYRKEHPEGHDCPSCRRGRRLAAKLHEATGAFKALYGK